MPGEKLSHSGDQFGKREGKSWLLRPRGIHLNEHVDGSYQGKDVAQVDVVVTPVGPRVSQVQELRGKFAGVRRAKTATRSVKRRALFRLLANCKADRCG